MQENDFINSFLNNAFAPFDQQDSALLKAYREKTRPNNKELEEFQRLCYEVFVISEQGKQLYEMLVKKFVIPQLFSWGDKDVQYSAIYWEGFKSAIRGLMDSALCHLKRANNGV
jgi:hypothetical protein